MASRPTGVPWVLFTMYGSGDQKEWRDLFWFNFSGGPVNANLPLNTIATAIYSALTNFWPAAITTHETIRGGTLEIGDGAGNVFSTVKYSDTPGTGISEPMPEDVAVVVRKRTAVGTASGKGRWYFYGAGQADVNGSYLNSSGLTDWQNFAATLKVPVTSGAFTMEPSHFSPTTGLFSVILDTPVVSLLGTRRSRRTTF